MKKYTCFLLFWVMAFCGKAQIITTVAGNGVAGFSGNGNQATSAEINWPNRTAIDTKGNIYIADNNNNRVRKVSISGIIVTFAGNGIAGYSGDGGPAINAKLYDPLGVAVDAIGNVYIADYVNNRIRIVSTSGIIHTFAGNGIWGYSGDGGQATNAEISRSTDVAIDTIGNIYFTDNGNFCIRKVNTLGIISTIAGNGVGGNSGNGGPATAAEFLSPYGVAVDASGNVYIADASNNSNHIRKVNTAGIIGNFAGNGVATFAGDGGPATSASLNSPTGVAVDNLGSVFVADDANWCIRMVNSAGIINTIAGNGIRSYSGDGGPATSAELAAPTGVSVDISGNIYIADNGNNRIRKVSGLSILTTIVASIRCYGDSNGIAIANPTGGSTPYTYLWSGGYGTTDSASNLIAGNYLLEITDNFGYYILDSFIITQPPAISIISDSLPDNGSCNGSAWANVSGGVPPYNYVWTGGLTTDTILNQCAGFYCIHVTDSYGCLDSLCVNIPLNISTGNTLISNSTGIEVYPNPNNGVFTIQLSVVSSKLSVEVYNVLGERVKTQCLPEGHGQAGIASLQTTIDLSNQPNGLYFYRVISENGNLIGDGKMLIQK